MTERTDQLKKEWDQRSARLGSTQRAVLFKRFPGWLNQSIHRRHVRFIADNCPSGVSRVLDVGCGYGRISIELAERFPEASFLGVDLSTEFARHYEQNVGPCFNGPIQEFHSDDTYDLILIVTTLMYLSAEEHVEVLKRLWSSLAPGGRILCVEPASELFIMWRRLTGKASASPTGGTVEHFLRQQLVDKFAHLDGRRVVGTRSVNLLPYIGATAVHHCVAVERRDEA
ncbi:MAG TPA: class I SAM-dependent methyltransferase [Woeseiaceae bacterium]|jgi:SAM-dependent methyltransferase|nr:class I SAM-dependent methyltransferase [Woeseiaceae bacterium]